MTKLLDPAAVERYRREGICFPIPICTPEEAAEQLRRLEALEAREGGRLSGNTNIKPHLLLPWVDQLVRHPRILDAVEDVIGPDILCWGSQFFIKGAHDPGFISWHQDATYWGLSTADVLTAWFAFTPSTVQSGCLRVVPGSHLQQVAHRETGEASNMLSRGQEIAVEVDEDEAVDVVLQPGQASLHNVLIFHSSKANRADHRRVGLAIRYIAPHVRQTAGPRDSATLVRGKDAFGNFDLIPPPRADFDPEAVARHAEVMRRAGEIQDAAARRLGAGA